MKRIISFLLLFTIFFTLNPLLGFANNESYCKEDTVKLPKNPDNIIFKYWKDWNNFSYSYMYKKSDSPESYWIVKDWVILGDKYINYGMWDFVYTLDWGYAYMVANDNEWFVIENGIEWPKMDYKINAFWMGWIRPILGLSHYNESKIYKWHKNGKYFFVKNWVPISKEYEEIRNDIFLPDINNLIYIAVDSNWKEMVVKGEIEGPKYDYIANLTVSPDKKSFAYIGGQKYSKQDLIKDWVILNNDGVISFSPTYSSDSKSFSYFGVKDWRNIVIKDWVEIENTPDTIEKISQEFIRYIPNTHTLVYKKYKDWKHILMKDWVEWKLYDSINTIYYSKGLDVFYLVADWNFPFFSKKYIVKNNIEEWKYDDISWDIVFSPDNTSYAYVAKIWGNRFTEKNGEGVYLEEKEKLIIVKDGVEIGKEYDSSFNPTYSPDGKSFIYSAIKNWKNILVKDGIELDMNIDGYQKLRFNYLSNWNFYMLGYSKDNIEMISLNWKDWKVYDYTSLEKSSDWKNISYIVDENWQRVLVKNWVEIVKNNYRILSHRNSPDWQNYAYVSISNITKEYFLTKVFCWNSIKNDTNNEKKSKFLKQKEDSMINIKKSKKEKYINIIDKIVDSNNKEKLTPVFNKIQLMKQKNDIIKYIEASIYLKINK